MPDERVLEQLCALSGDDVAVFAAQIQAERARTNEGKTLWLMIAKRLAGGASTAILSVLFSIGLIATPSSDARATGLNDLKTCYLQVYTSYEVRFCQLCARLERLRWRAKGLPGFLRLCWLSAY